MKRNNLFMLSYIIFIFIAFFVKLFCDFPMWPPLVTAITIASCIFACSDIVDVVAEEYGNDEKSFTPLLDSALEKCVHLETVFQSNAGKLQDYKENGSYLAEVLLEGPTQLDAVKKQLTEITNGINLKRTVSSCCNKVSKPLLIVGYLSFFCTVTFETINGILVPIQDYLTVFAFGLLLATQYFGNYAREEHVALEKNYTEANALLEDTYKTTNDALAFLEQEATANAD